VVGVAVGDAVGALAAWIAPPVTLTALVSARPPPLIESPRTAFTPSGAKSGTAT
jgi:hypothetical protein